MQSLNQKVVLVTGGANGIGQCIVREFLKAGAKHVAFLDMDESSGHNLENELKLTFGEKRVTFIKGDVSDEASLFGAYDKIVEEHGRLDVAVNNAGIADESPSMYKKTIEINFTATVTSTLKALEIMREDLGGKGGTIINISSITAVKLLSPGFIIYGATKSAVLHFSNCIGMDPYFKRTNVRVITVCLGQTVSDLKNKARLFHNNVITIDEIKEKLKNLGTAQSSEMAAKGILESYENGSSGSTWLVNNSKISDITANVKHGYDIMGKEVNNA